MAGSLVPGSFIDLAHDHRLVLASRTLSAKVATSSLGRAWGLAPVTAATLERMIRLAVQLPGSDGCRPLATTTRKSGRSIKRRRSRGELRGDDRFPREGLSAFVRIW